MTKFEIERFLVRNSIFVSCKWMDSVKKSVAFPCMQVYNCFILVMTYIGNGSQSADIIRKHLAV